MRVMKSQEIESLEALVDNVGLKNVLEELGAICAEKAVHVMDNWQDAELSKLWERAMNVCDTASARKCIEEVSR